GGARAGGPGPGVLALPRLRGWSAAGPAAVAQAARLLAEHGRSLELAAIPADGSLVPDATCPDIPVHADLPAALAAHRPVERVGKHWRTGNWPTAAATLN
ncbi:anti-sigma factor antagonist, partial [Streptomyces sp. NPDC004050]